jgi:hypothetical protein
MTHSSLASRARTCGLLLPKQARCLLRHSQSVGLPRFELGASRSRSVRATKLRYNPFTWTASDSNREPSPCRGVALPIGASSPLGCPRGRGHPSKLAGRIRAHAVPSRAACVVHGVPLWICQVQPGTFTPEGGAPQGWQESNPQPAVLEAAALPLRHIPMQLKNRPRGLPGERPLVERVLALSRSLPGRQHLRLQARRRGHADMPFASLAPDG